jgi:Zn-dependent alcohol dehydrogenase
MRQGPCDGTGRRGRYRLQFDPMIAHVMPLADALNRMKRGEKSIRGVVTF